MKKTATWSPKYPYRRANGQERSNELHNLPLEGRDEPLDCAEAVYQVKASRVQTQRLNIFHDKGFRGGGIAMDAQESLVTNIGTVTHSIRSFLRAEANAPAGPLTVKLTLSATAAEFSAEGTGDRPFVAFGEWDKRSGLISIKSIAVP